MTTPTFANAYDIALGHLSTGGDSEPLDLSAYLERIGNDGPFAPTLDTLRTFQAAHLTRSPSKG